MLGIGADAGAEIEHDQFAAHRRPARRDGGAVDARHGPEVEFRHRHQGAGIAGRDGDIGLAALDRIDGEPHRTFPAALAQRLARLGVHRNRDVGVDEAGDGLQRRAGGEQRLDDRAVAEQQEFDVRMPPQRQFRAGDDHRGPMVSPHGVERDTDFIGHGATIACGSTGTTGAHAVSARFRRVTASQHDLSGD